MNTAIGHSSAANAPTALSPAHVAERVAETIDGLFATIDGWRDRLQNHLETDAAPTAATLDPVVEAFAVSALAANGLITGSGFVAAPGLLSDAQWHLAWWLGGAAGIRRLATIDDPSNDQFRDYTTLEWWRFPARTGARHVTGPYVDYVCTDDYTVTITTPVTVGGRLLGVVGMDVLVDRLERELLPLLRAAGVPIAVVNA
ncbi:MAG: PDC sensor domain-containing protein, partial [Microbacterium sp.]